MMTTESYQSRGDFDHTYRSSHRRIDPTSYYHRAAPYGYYEHGRQDVRQQYFDHHHDHAAIEDGETTNQGEQRQRRRISVACARCRKRKIKCSGDPGDGSGCGACKSVGLDLAQNCTFMRVNAKPLQMAPVEMLTHATYPGQMSTTSYDVRSITGDRRASERYHYRSRSSIPVLHTRSSYRPDLDSPVSNSPMDAYSYVPSTIPRQDSVVSTYGTEGLRTWSSSYATAPPPTPSYYDLHAAYSFGTMQAPEPQHYNRLPSVSAESLSSLNMGHLHSSLPSQGAHERRLPIPYMSQHPQAPFSQPEVPAARPLGSFSAPRIPINGIQTRNALPWPLDTGSTTARTSSMSAYAPPNGLPTTCSQPMPSFSESAFGYHFQPTAPAVAYNSSPELSPTSGPNHSASLDSSSSSGESSITMHPFSNLRYYTSTQQDMSPLTSTDRPSSSRQRSIQQMSSLYSFGTASSDLQSNASEQEGGGLPSSGVTTYSLPVRDRRGSMDGDTYAYNDPSNSSSYQNPIQHPRPLPHHSASIDSLYRRSPFEQQRPRSSTASRMSISNFDSSYQ